MSKRLGLGYMYYCIDTKEWLPAESITDLAKQLKCSRQHVYNELADGKATIQFKGNTYKLYLK